MSTYPMTAIVLCGGSSQRLGYPKEMLRVDGAPLVIRTAERLRRIFSAVHINSNNPAFLRFCSPFPVYPDAVRDMGPLAGLHAGLRHAGTDRCFFLPCDMPFVPDDHVRRLVERALASSAKAVTACLPGRREPLCGVYSRELLPRLEVLLTGESHRSVAAFLDAVGAESVDFSAADAPSFRDIDAAEDIPLLNRIHADVEPLPVARLPIRSGRSSSPASDIVAVEYPLSLYVNGLKLVTVLCLPTAMREMAVGLAVYLGLVRRREEIRGIRMDYDAKRAMLQLDVSDEAIRSASQVLITSTCGASIYGGRGESPGDEAVSEGRRIRLAHILDCLRVLRPMGPVFSRAGSTHQAAFSDGERLRLFFEDIGRHNAVDKIIGASLLEDMDLAHGVIMATGRLSSEMVIKAARRGVPILASPSGVTTNAVDLAAKHAITFIGFARGGRANIYTRPERVIDDR